MALAVWIVDREWAERFYDVHRFEWREPLSFQGGLMLHLPITR